MNHDDRETIIRILSNAFDQNPRIRTMVKSKNSAHHIRTMTEYALQLIEKFDGVYFSEDRTTVLLYYRKSQYRLGLPDKLRYLRMVLRTVRPSQFLPTRRRERIIEGLRPDYDDYIYVWVLGSDPDQRGIRGLADIRDHLFGLSEQLQLPILIETTLEKLLKLYRYVGFEVYKQWRDEEAGLDIWLLERGLKPAENQSAQA
ncbi:MAG: hypothetical protein CSA96_05495 [Bacteroidetes bacterium]|nr:MAG: hypothetical protein CSA96_05495 [Bacteroidota bacterium]